MRLPLVLISIYIQELFIVFSYKLSAGESITWSKLWLYNPFHLQVGMLWYLPSSALSLFIVPLFIVLHKRFGIKTLGKSFGLGISILLALYLFGLISMPLLWPNADVVWRFILYPWPLDMERAIIFWGFLVGNLLFLSVFVPFWHYRFQKLGINPN